MQKHPIPQNIMDVEFKLFGSLTVRQFMSLSGGIIVALFIYFFKIPIIIRIPIMTFSVLLGLAMAFVEVNGQPFSRWFTSFLKAMFSSQKYVWRKESHTPKVLKPTSGIDIKDVAKGSAIKKELSRAPLLDALSEADRNQEPLEQDEKMDLERIDRYFENEFGKEALRKQEPQVKERDNHNARIFRRVDLDQQNLAGDVNSEVSGRTVVTTGPHTRAVMTGISNQSPRRLEKDDIDLKIEAKIKEILEKQRELDPFVRTLEVEEREKELRKQMRELYNEIQKLKSKKHG